MGAIGRTFALLITITIVVGLLVWWVLSPGSDMGDMPGMSPSGRSTQPEPIANLEGQDFHALLLDQQDPTRLLFGSHDGVQVSEDEGHSWQAGTLSEVDAMQLTSSPATPNTIFATGHDVFQVSRDGGTSWQPTDHTLPGTDIHAFAQDPVDPARVYAVVAGEGVFRSSDTGRTWSELPSRPPGDGEVTGLSVGAAGLVAITQMGLAVSRDGGESWMPRLLPVPAAVTSVTSSADDPNTLYLGTTQGLFRSVRSGNDWEPMNLDGVTVVALAMSRKDPSLLDVLGADGTLFRSDDAGRSWG